MPLRMRRATGALPERSFCRHSARTGLHQQAKDREARVLRQRSKGNYSRFRFHSSNIIEINILTSSTISGGFGGSAGWSFGVHSRHSLVFWRLVFCPEC